MATNAQRKAVKEHRRRRSAAGIARFEVSAPAQDKELLRTLAKRLSQGGAQQVRAELRKALSRESESEVGAIARALRASPLYGADIDFPREKAEMRKVEFE